MPPRIDPYANKTHRRIDLVLVVITLLLIAFAFRYSANSRAVSRTPDTMRAEQTVARTK